MSDQSLLDRYGAHLLGLLAASLLLWQFANWWTQPPAVEFNNLKYIQLLSTAVSSRKPELVDKVELAIRLRHSESKMSADELAHFERIMATARSGRWEDADRETYDFAAAQLSRRRSAPAAEEAHAHVH